MTIDQFRSSSAMTAHIKAILTQDVTFQTAIVAVQGDIVPRDVSGNADPVESVRRLSYLAGYTDAIKALLSCSEPLIPAPVDPEPTWGQPERPEDAELPKEPTIL